MSLTPVSSHTIVAQEISNQLVRAEEVLDQGILQAEQDLEEMKILMAKLSSSTQAVLLISSQPVDLTPLKKTLMEKETLLQDMNRSITETISRQERASEAKKVEIANLTDEIARLKIQIANVK